MLHRMAPALGVGVGGALLISGLADPSGWRALAHWPPHNQMPKSQLSVLQKAFLGVSKKRLKQLTSMGCLLYAGVYTKTLTFNKM